MTSGFVDILKSAKYEGAGGVETIQSQGRWYLVGSVRGRDLPEIEVGGRVLTALSKEEK